MDEIDGNPDPAAARPSRRGAVLALAAGGAIVAAPPIAAAPRAPAPIRAQAAWTPEPPQVPVRSGTLAVGDAELFYWDTGGGGETIVLLHAFTGSAATWGYQQPVLARAGYRVVGYSRRGHFRSGRGPADRPGRASDDLHALANGLGLGRFHLLGTAAGGFTAVDYALSHSDRLLGLVLASTQCGIDEPDFLAVSRALTGGAFEALPPELKELGPSYRAANPAGMARWRELQREAVPGEPVRQAKANIVTWAALGSIRLPTLLMTGDADLYMPPSRAREVAAHLRCTLATLPEAGHAAFWEQPALFNDAVLGFLRTLGGKEGRRRA